MNNHFTISTFNAHYNKFRQNQNKNQNKNLNEYLLKNTCDIMAFQEIDGVQLVDKKDWQTHRLLQAVERDVYMHLFISKRFQIISEQIKGNFIKLDQYRGTHPYQAVLIKDNDIQILVVNIHLPHQKHIRFDHKRLEKQIQKEIIDKIVQEGSSKVLQRIDQLIVLGDFNEFFEQEENNLEFIQIGDFKLINNLYGKKYQHGDNILHTGVNVSGLEQIQQDVQLSDHLIVKLACKWSTQIYNIIVLEQQYEYGDGDQQSIIQLTRDGQLYQQLKQKGIQNIFMLKPFKNVDEIDDQFTEITYGSYLEEEKHLQQLNCKILVNISNSEIKVNDLVRIQSNKQVLMFTDSEEFLKRIPFDDPDLKGVNFQVQLFNHHQNITNKYDQLPTYNLIQTCNLDIEYDLSSQIYFNWKYLCQNMGQNLDQILYCYLHEEQLNEKFVNYIRGVIKDNIPRAEFTYLLISEQGINFFNPYYQNDVINKHTVKQIIDLLKGKNQSDIIDKFHEFKRNHKKIYTKMMKLTKDQITTELNKFPLEKIEYLNQNPYQLNILKKNVKDQKHRDIIMHLIQKRDGYLFRETKIQTSWDVIVQQKEYLKKNFKLPVLDCFSSPFDSLGDVQFSFYPKYDRFFDSKGKIFTNILPNGHICLLDSFPDVDLYAKQQQFIIENLKRIIELRQVLIISFVYYDSYLTVNGLQTTVQVKECIEQFQYKLDELAKLSKVCDTYFHYFSIHVLRAKIFLIFTGISLQKGTITDLNEIIRQKWQNINTNWPQQLQ